MRLRYLCLAICLSGSVSLAGTGYHMTTPFRAADFQAWTQGGDATLSGVVNYDDYEGTMRHCSGARIELIPATPYNTEMVRATKAASWRPVTGVDRATARYVKTVSCDKAGTFHFTDLPAQRWFVRTTLSWNDTQEYSVAHKKSVLIRRVDLQHGRNQVVLSATDRVVEYRLPD